MSIKTIQQYTILLDAIMQEWEKISGVNRQRQGGIGEYEGKSSSQQAILQSSHITEDLFRKFAQFEQRELQGLLDYSKEAWLSGKKASFIMPDTTMQFLDIDSLGHMESEYGIFVSDAGKDLQNLEQARQLSQAMVQNGMPASAVFELFDTESFTQLKDKIKQAEKTQQQLQQAQQEAEMQMKQQEMQTNAQLKQIEIQDKDKDRQTKIEIALIQAEAADQTNRLNIDLEKIAQEYMFKEKDQDLKERELQQKSELQAQDNNTKLQLEDKKAQTQKNKPK
jgi:hypothetical protein